MFSLVWRYTPLVYACTHCIVRAESEWPGPSVSSLSERLPRSHNGQACVRAFLIMKTTINQRGEYGRGCAPNILCIISRHYLRPLCSLCARMDLRDSTLPRAPDNRITPTLRPSLQLFARRCSFQNKHNSVGKNIAKLIHLA